MPGLRDAIEGLYRVFARHPLAARIDGCPHCELDANERSLHAAPLRELGEEDFGRYPFKAMTTFGDVDDFRHFFPRIAELVTFEGAVGACDLATLASKLAYGAWQTWPEPERAAVLAWLTALEDAYFAGEPCRVYRIELLDACATLRGDTYSFITRWTRARANAALEELADEVIAAATDANRGDPTRAGVLVPLRPAIEAALQRALAGGAERDVVQRALDTLAFPPFSA